MKNLQYVSLLFNAILDPKAIFPITFNDIGYLCQSLGKLTFPNAWEIYELKAGFHQWQSQRHLVIKEHLRLKKTENLS